MILTEIQEKAKEYFNSRYNCAQSVVMAFRDAGLLPKDLDEAMFAGFGGGFACTGNTCGAITGLTAVISHNKINRAEPTIRKDVYLILRKAFDEFTKEYPSLACRDITHLDMTTPEGQEKYLKDVHFQVCVPLVMRAVELAYKELRA